MNNKIIKVGTIITGVLTALGGLAMLFGKASETTEVECAEEACDCEVTEVEDVDEIEE